MMVTIMISTIIGYVIMMVMISSIINHNDHTTPVMIMMIIR